MSAAPTTEPQLFRRAAITLLLLGACGLPAEGPDPVECADRADNDGDGRFDCDDEGCAGTAACAPVAELPACEVEGAGGTVKGVHACKDGICELAAGASWMGEAAPAYPDRCPAHQVQLSAFAADQAEVKRSAYADCVEAGVCEAPASPCAILSEEEASLPAACIRWGDARDYCAWRGGRLPTEAEWERAARGEDGAIWPWGEVPPTCNDANFRFASSYCEVGVVAVGSYPDRATASGLLDTSGNVWEWVEDWYDAGYYRDGPEVDPPGPEACRDLPEGEPGECRYKVMRGGAFNTAEQTTRGTARSFADPEVQDVNLGFRCAYDR